MNEGERLGLEGSSSVLELSVASSVAAGTYTLKVRGKAGGAESSSDLVVKVDSSAGFRPATDPSGITLTLDRLFYADGQAATVTLNFNGNTPPMGPVQVALGAPGASDAEVLELKKGADGVYTSDPVPLKASSASDETMNGVLSLTADTDFYALYFFDPADPAFKNVEEDVVFDVAFFEASASADAPVVIEPAIALSEDETNPPAGAKAVGTLLTKDGYPVQIATEELILYPRDEDQLNAFLKASGGKVSSRFEGLTDGEPTAYLVQLAADLPDAANLSKLRDYVGEDDTLYASNDGALAIYYLALYYQLEGYIVAVNPRLQMQGAPQISATETGNVTHSVQMKPDGCIPGDTVNPCVENVPALWAFTALWDGDTKRVNAAFLDIGFAPNPDFRPPTSGNFVECDMSAGGIGGFRCGTGIAEGPPTVGNGFFGDKSWHGTGVVSTAGGVVNNNFGVAGVAGQTMVPMLYKYDFASYAFEIGLGMRKATDDGASCINISGGYPCKILTTVGPDFNICTAAGRAGICAVATVGAHAAAAAVCGAVGWVPLFGSVACGAAVSGAVAVTGACISTLAFGDLSGPMARGTAYAHQRGVPVVVSAGNRLSRDKLPPVVRDLVDLSNISSDDWQIVPAVFSTTISVGAVDSNLDNVHFVGDTVDIWAPIRSAYMAPEDVADIRSTVVIHKDASGPLKALGGTSAAAPFITGVIATMQALNPSLNRHTPGLSDAERSTIVERIRTLLTADANSFSNAELTALGYSNQPERRLLVDPLAAVRATAIGFDSRADFVAAGYDASLNFSEASAPNDSPAQAQTLSYGATVTGTILVIPREDASGTPPDEDWYTFAMPSNPNPNRVFATTVTVQSPDDPRGDIVFIDNRNFKQVSRGSATVYKVLAYTENTLPFVLKSNAGGDNVYKLSLAEPQLELPNVEITAPVVPGETLCAGQPVNFAAAVGFNGFPEIGVAPSDIAWRRDGLIFATGPSPSLTFTEGNYTINVTVFGDSSASDSVTITVEDCIGTPPTVVITNPADNPNASEPDLDVQATANDADGWYYRITLTATVTDDETLERDKIVWTTDRADLQPGGPTSGSQVLGTGASITTKLYAQCSAAVHTVTLRVEDEDGQLTSDVRTLFIRLLC